VRGVSARINEDGKRIALGASATSVHWIGDQAMFALGDGAVLAAQLGGDPRRIVAHDGAILCAASHPDGQHLITGGDDGKLMRIAPDGVVENIADLRKWIDHIVATPVTNIIVAAVGKEAIVLKGGAELHRFCYPSTVGGLALDAKGRRLAASHYGGATLRYALMADDKGVSLPWVGSHLAVTLSSDADYLITAMQENALHGWRLPEKTDLRMDGYPAKTRSFSWDKRGRWLATSGADSAIVWPFVGKLGPQGKPPLQLGAREALVSAVAFHPSTESLAIGYSDGAAVLVGLADQTALELDEPGEGAVTALAWRADGRALAIGDEAGRGAIIAFDA
jgi:WD40 repeat protein